MPHVGRNHGRCIAMGMRTLRHGDRKLTFVAPVDITYSPASREGTIYAQGTPQPEDSRGFELRNWGPIADEGWKTNNTHRASFSGKSGQSMTFGDEA